MGYTDRKIYKEKYIYRRIYMVGIYNVKIVDCIYDKVYKVEYKHGEVYTR